MEGKRSPVFLSHTTANADMMQEIADYIEERNIPCWYAPRNIPPGDEYDFRIAEDIEKLVGAVVVLITEEVAHSKYVPKEITLAYKYSKKVIPLVIDNAPIPKNLEFKLANVQWVDMSKYENEEDAIDYLVELLELMYQGEEIQPNLLERVRKPVVLEQRFQTSLYEVDSTIILKTRKVFERPPAFSTIKKILKQQHCVYLYNPHHIGKYTLAVASLDNMGLDDIFEWSKETSFKQIIAHPIRPNAGFIIDIESVRDFFYNVSEHEVERFFRKIASTNTYFVFVSKEEAPFENIQDCSVKLEAPEDGKRLIINHANWMEQDESIREKMLNWIKSEKTDQFLPKEIYPRYAAEYVTKIRQLVTGEMSENIFLHSLDVNVINRIKGWFKQPYTIRDLAFYLTIGLFEGQRYQTIIQKSEELLNLFYEHFGEPEMALELQIPGRDEYLLRFHAEVRQGWIQSNAGRESVEGVYHLFQQDVKVLWEYLWMQYPSYQKPIVSWLQMLAKKSQRGIEEDMLDLIVHLLKRDSQNVRNQIVLPWAKSTQHRDRLYASRLLEKLAQDEDYLHMVFTLAKSWVRQSNNDRLQWTAIVLLGSNVGASYFSQSLILLREVFNNDHNKQLTYPIQRSFEQLSKHVVRSQEYEKLFYGFWIDWFSSVEGERFIKLLQFAHGIFLAQPRLFFQSGEEWQEGFWKKLLENSYVKNSTRKSVEELMNQWILSASGSLEQLRIADVVFSLYHRVENKENQDRLEKFIDTGLKKDHDQYGPIHQHLITF